MRRFVVLEASLLLLVALFANAASRNNMIQIKVLDSQTQSSAPDDNGVARNCDQVTFDAYCRSSRTAPLVNTLLVQEGDGPPFRVACTAESKWSRCVPLEAGVSFEAKREKHGITIYYIDGQGKARSQLYALVEAEAKASPVAPAASVASRPSAVPAENTGQVPGTAAAAARPRETVKCSFSSTPSGADVTLDGRYVGSTPSVVGLSTGTHVVVISMAGFAQWKRELAVTSGSDLTVNAILQKAQ